MKIYIVKFKGKEYKFDNPDIEENDRYEMAKAFAEGIQKTNPEPSLISLDYITKKE